MSDIGAMAPLAVILLSALAGCMGTKTASVGQHGDNFTEAGGRPFSPDLGLRTRAEAAYNSYRVRVTVLNKATGEPIHRARVVINLINVHGGDPDKMSLLRLDWPGPAVSSTDPKGHSFFGISRAIVFVADDSMRYVVSATAAGFGYKHALLKKAFSPDIVQDVDEHIVAFTADELSDLKPDETVTLELSPMD